MFDENISGELPEHISFIKEKCIPLFAEWGYETKILHSKKTYMDCFNNIVRRSKIPERNGKRSGFPMAGKCAISRDCKLRAIKQFFKGKNSADFVQYVGIAVDEPKRLERLDGTNKISLLEKYGYTEKMAFDLCEKYGLLSPIYSFCSRGGCWFCPNAGYSQLKHLRTNHENLWYKLLELESLPNLVGDKWNTLTGRSMKENEEKFLLEEKVS